MADPAHYGTAALEALDRAHAHKPKRDDEAFSAATEQLCLMRDSLPADAPPADRDAVNAIISAVLAGHFPIGAIPWPEVEAAITQLRALLARM